MNPKVKKNHYNVKFLKGYGFSISVKDSKLILKNCADPFSEPEQEEWFGNNMPYSKIIMSGKGYVSTEALSILSENNKNLILLDTYGKPVTYLNPVRIGEGLTATKYRIGQYDTFRDEKKRKYLTEWILKEKKDSQIRFLNLTNKPEMESYIKRLENSSPNEAVFSRIYFDAYSKLIDPRFGFTKRNSYDIRKNNATDIINALLNYGYTVLAGEISSYINGIGLDAYYGFMHKNHSGFQSLVYDMMEPFRWLVDYTVWKFSEQKSRNRISKKQYAYTKEGFIVMDYSLTRKFLESLHRSFQMKRKYGLKTGKDITMAKIIVSDLAEYCIDKQNEFRIHYSCVSTE